jgi:hypothetical protein
LKFSMFVNLHFPSFRGNRNCSDFRHDYLRILDILPAMKFIAMGTWRVA